ncbi:MAG: hypothetical protein M0Z78_05810 [Betaproteobacteria bacterium]|nr:hypothetical protein [Betaproteobacteria bacterium]
MTLLTVCSSSIDWSATGSWFSGLATSAGVIVACRAMTTWKQQIRLQDRYQKADALLHSFIVCLRAGYDWQCACGFGENRDPLLECDATTLWRKSLMDYRLHWDLAHPLFVGCSCNTLMAHPEKLQSAIIGSGIHLLDSSSGIFLFLKKLENIRSVVMSEIIARRNVK